MRRAYIAGPMTKVGPPDFNYPSFNSLEAWLVIHGLNGEACSPLNPARNFNGATDREYREYMRADLKMIAQADAIVLLPGWRDSPGALLEVDIARKLELDFYEAAGPRKILAGRPVGWKVTKINTPTHAAGHYSASPWHAGESYSAPAAEPLADWERELLNVAMLPAAKTAGDDGRTTTFASGATRDTSAGKLDFEGFLNPLVIERFARYMDKNRLQSNGTYRDSDNWQAGFTRASYAKSLWRHFMDFWKRHRGYDARSDVEEALCAVIFNASGYLLEVLLERDL